MGGRRTGPPIVFMAHARALRRDVRRGSAGAGRRGPGSLRTGIRRTAAGDRAGLCHRVASGRRPGEARADARRACGRRRAARPPCGGPGLVPPGPCGTGAHWRTVARRPAARHSAGRRCATRGRAGVVAAGGTARGARTRAARRQGLRVVQRRQAGVLRQSRAAGREGGQPHRGARRVRGVPQRTRPGSCRPTSTWPNSSGRAATRPPPSGR